MVGCDDDDAMPPASTFDFTVQIENISPVYEFLDAGVFNMPVGDAEPGPATPGKSYSFTVNAGVNQRLSFVTMLAATNDQFFAPASSGISLYDEDRNPISGDITDQIYLWDAGTEVNEEPAVGPNTVGNQSGPDTGEDENGNVLRIEDVEGDDFDYPEVDEIIRVVVAHNEGTEFTVIITDLATATLETSEGNQPAPISPGVWVVAQGEHILFEESMPDREQGIEGIAEDGNPMNLGMYTADNSGVNWPASPGVWIVHNTETMPLYTNGELDYGDGLEAIAEDGNPTMSGDNLSSADGYINGAVFNMPAGSDSPGPILSGSMYEFSFNAQEGDRLSFASMLAATNDVVFATNDEGIELFDSSGLPVSGDITNEIAFYDVGTEENEQPAIGLNTVTNQAGADTGMDESEPVQLLSNVDDGYSYPVLSNIYRIIISSN